ncbi:hypothetical protein diail_4892 [Diaporthe ilicicola]|nr:hypothetical protein diail_4892 [Diaporthe ilicicola]
MDVLHLPHALTQPDALVEIDPGPQMELLLYHEDHWPGRPTSLPKMISSEGIKRESASSAPMSTSTRPPAEFETYACGARLENSFGQDGTTLSGTECAYKETALYRAFAEGRNRVVPLLLRAGSDASLAQDIDADEAEFIEKHHGCHARTDIGRGCLQTHVEEGFPRQTPFDSLHAAFPRPSSAGNIDGRVETTNGICRVSGRAESGKIALTKSLAELHKGTAGQGYSLGDKQASLNEVIHFQRSSSNKHKRLGLEDALIDRSFDIGANVDTRMFSRTSGTYRSEDSVVFNKMDSLHHSTPRKTKTERRMGTRAEGQDVCDIPKSLASGGDQPIVTANFRGETARDIFLWMIGYRMMTSICDEQTVIVVVNETAEFLLTVVAAVDSCLNVLLPLVKRAARATQCIDEVHCLLEDPG